MKLWAFGNVIVSTCAVVHAQVIQWEIENVRHPSHLRRRGSSVYEDLIKNERERGGYFSTVQVGNPAQNLTLLLDTGSSDVWVPWCGSTMCKKTGGCPLGSFNPDKSESFHHVGPGLFKIVYDDDKYCKGDYFVDQFEIGGARLKNLTMGLGVKADIPFGLIGIGYAVNEALIDTADKMYPNLPMAMYEAGLINSIAYSLWLNDLGADTGNILFGGTDSAKYQGDLMRIDVQPEKDDTFVNLKVSMTSLLATSSSGNDTLTSSHFPIDVVLDSGTTLTYLPQDLVTQVWQEVGAEYSQDYEMAILPCSFANNNGYFSFGFGGPSGPRINVTMDEMVIDLSKGETPTFDSGKYKGEKICEFGIQNYSSSWYTLGTSFLRSAYVVYDLVNNQIGLAATNFNSTASKIQAFESKGANIPSATAVPNQSQATQKPETTQNDLTAARGLQGHVENAAALMGLGWTGLPILCLVTAIVLPFWSG